MIDEDYVPSTMEEAVDHMVARLSDSDREEIRRRWEKIKSEKPIIFRVDVNGVSKEREMRRSIMAASHFFTGMQIRNSWSFWKWNTPIKRDCIEKYQIAHADDMSGLLLEWVAHKAIGEPFDPVEHCQGYHEHWADYGQTSIEAGTPQTIDDTDQD